MRDIDDIAQYGKLSVKARMIAEAFLPGPLTLVLPARNEVPRRLRGPEDTVSFRISPDVVAQSVVSDFMGKYEAPLTCTSANVSGQSTLSTPEAILKQLGERAALVDEVIDDGPRSGTPSTVVRVIDDAVDILREGAIPEADVRSVVEA